MEKREIVIRLENIRQKMTEMIDKLYEDLNKPEQTGCRGCGALIGLDHASDQEGYCNTCYGDPEMMQE